MALETTPVQPVNPASSQAGRSRHAGRRADSDNASSAFAQLLRGQRDGTDAQAGLGLTNPAADAARPARSEARGDEADAAPEDGEDQPETQAARKLPSKLQLGAEDMVPEAMGLKGSHGADALGRMLSAGRAQARQAALGAERGREARQGASRGVGDDAAEKNTAAGASFAGLLAATEPRSVDAASATVAATTALQAPQQNTAAVSVEGVLPSLAAPGEAPPVATAPQPAPLPAVPDAYATLAASPGSEAFPAALGAQLSTWMNEGVEYAQLELNPRDLGPIDVRIALRDGDTRIELGANVASTREALEQALPQLAEALGDVGLAMSGGQVSDQTAGGRSGGGDPQAQARQASAWLRGAGSDGPDAAAPLPRPPVNPRALLDMYA
ncbi:MAG TPA: flagellar hook-length control protein FliK [Ideonella sp.]|nr:flagellar hook-length control protein FliK [Ideonella sp.]